MEMNGVSAYGCANAYSKVDVPGRYELNAKEFGPVVATAISVGEQAAQVAGNVVNAVKADVNAVENKVADWAHAGADTLSFIEKKAASAASGVADAASAVVDELGSVAGSVADYASSAAVAGANAFDAFI